MTLGPSAFHVQLYKGSQHRRSVSLIAFVVLAVSAFGQSPQIVLGSSQYQSSQDTNPSGMAEAFPVTAPKTGQVSSLYVFWTAPTRPLQPGWACTRAGIGILEPS